MAAPLSPPRRQAGIAEEVCTPPHQKITTSLTTPPEAPKRQQQSLTKWFNRPLQDSLDLRAYFLGLPIGEPMVTRAPLNDTLERLREEDDEVTDEVNKFSPHVQATCPPFRLSDGRKRRKCSTSLRVAEQLAGKEQQDVMADVTSALKPLAVGTSPVMPYAYPPPTPTPAFTPASLSSGNLCASPDGDTHCT